MVCCGGLGILGHLILFLAIMAMGCGQKRNPHHYAHHSPRPLLLAFPTSCSVCSLPPSAHPIPSHPIPFHPVHLIPTTSHPLTQPSSSLNTFSSTVNSAISPYRDHLTTTVRPSLSLGRCLTTFDGFGIRTKLRLTGTPRVDGIRTPVAQYLRTPFTLDRMPGILPMKVIKVGSSSQSRIAQACDRCRSKKIRCDGIRPCCSQCSNVGFECKTSDKLSRRAFPRGYTESLEERVRALEAEVRELKDLLDEKDEKIDMLSKMHQNRRPSTSSASIAAESRKELVSTPPKEDVFRVQASPLLLGSENSDSYFMGASSGRAFVGM